MFQSKSRDIVVPQSEHARLAGQLASLWGNDQFDRPPLDFESFVVGVTYHDREYGFLDNYPLLNMPRETWVKLKRQHLEMRLDDPVADLICMLHVRRLLNHVTEVDVVPVIADVEAAINSRLTETPHTRAVFEWTDRITEFCDNVAFDFAFDTPAHGETTVYTHQGSTTDSIQVQHAISANGTITVDPWPFSLFAYAGYILGYQADGYPNKLQPVLLPFIVQPASASSA